jgi:hypothetical protein
LFAANQSIIWERAEFDIIQKSSKSLLEIMTLMSSTNNIGSDKEFILRGRSLIQIMNNKGPRIDPWGTPCFNVTQSQKNVALN